MCTSVKLYGFKKRITIISHKSVHGQDVLSKFIEVAESKSTAAALDSVIDIAMDTEDSPPLKRSFPFDGFSYRRCKCGVENVSFLDLNPGPTSSS